MNVAIFNLIATLYACMIGLPNDEYKDNNSISKELEDRLHRDALELLENKIDENNVFSLDKILMTDKLFDDIIKACDNYNKQNAYLFYRTLLCELDRMIDIRKLIDAYAREDSVAIRINSLNDNSEKTGITIIPKVPSLPNVMTNGKSYKDGHYWDDNINFRLNNIMCIQNSLLNGYTINNVVVDIFNGDYKRDKLTIGVSCCNDTNFLNKEMYCDKETQRQYFKIKDCLDYDVLTNKFFSCLEVAQKNNVDIIMGLEMYGTTDLCYVNEYGFNPRFRNLNATSPYIIISPSIWKDHKNWVSIYSNSGEHIGNQYKQHRFELKCKDGTNYLEDIKDFPKEILLIHIPGCGRIAIPICVDFLNTPYMDILVRHLNVDLLLCPSYSYGTIQFTNFIDRAKGFGTRTVWVDSCDAIKEHNSELKQMGIVSVPASDPSQMVSSPTPICAGCHGKCNGCCIYVIEIQTNNHEACDNVNIRHVPL